MAVSVEGSNDVATSGTSIAKPAGANCIAISMHCADNVEATVPTGVTWNGVALAKAVERDSGLAANSIWVLSGPDSGTRAVAWTGGVSVRAAMVCWLGGVGPSPTGDSATANADTVLVPGVSAADFVLFGQSRTGNDAMTPQGATVEILENTNANGHGAIGYTVGGTGTGGWAGIGEKATCGLKINAAGGSQVIMVAIERWKGFLRDLRMGLVPPDQLRRLFRDAVTI